MDESTLNHPPPFCLLVSTMAGWITCSPCSANLCESDWIHHPADMDGKTDRIVSYELFINNYTSYVLWARAIHNIKNSHSGMVYSIHP